MSTQACRVNLITLLPLNTARFEDFLDFLNHCGTSLCYDGSVSTQNEDDAPLYLNVTQISPRIVEIAGPPYYCCVIDVQNHVTIGHTVQIISITSSNHAESNLQLMLLLYLSDSTHLTQNITFMTIAVSVLFKPSVMKLPVTAMPDIGFWQCC